MNWTPSAVFVPWLHMHQPPIWVSRGGTPQLMGNLEKMLQGEPNSEETWNAQWYAQAYKNPAYYIEKLSQEGYTPRLMVDYSGVLLEELALLSQNGTFASLKVAGEPIGDVIGLFRQVLETYPQAIEFAGTAYSHCYFPATPERDHEAQILRWRSTFADLFGETALARIRGFWLPEMGMMGNPAQAVRFIRLLKRCGYEWLIVPHSALQHPDGWNNPRVENQVHWLVVDSGGESERILCVLRDTDMGIRQQSGQNADGCISGSRDRASALQSAGITTPALVVPTSDGENGNVMMFEYFSNSFAPLFQNAGQWQDIAFMTVSEYIDTFQNNPDTELHLNETGGSWIGGHESWLTGDERLRVFHGIEELSQAYSNLSNPSSDLEKALLLCQTSCFVYWNSPFWFEQAQQMLAWARELFGSPELPSSSNPPQKQKKIYNKLIRDKIPEIIQQAGNECEVVTLSSEDYIKALRKKILEEAQEVSRSQDSQSLKTELADLYEVIQSLMVACEIDKTEVVNLQKQRHEERGGFEKRLQLLWTITQD